MRKKFIYLALFLAIALFLYWIYKIATKPLPGEAVPAMGRDHVTDIYGVVYNSNPPTSGPHFPVWAKAGVYDRLISDGYLIHSMEHGYVIIWYDCSKALSGSLLKTAYAHDEPSKDSTDSGALLMHMKVTPSGTMSWFTPENPPEKEIELPDSFRVDSCKSLVGELAEFTSLAQRVIVVPRLNMDTPIALTAWERIEKLNSLDSERIKAFIKAFHNKGPEQTVE